MLQSSESTVISFRDSVKVLLDIIGGIDLYRTDSVELSKTPVKSASGKLSRLRADTLDYIVQVIEDAPKHTKVFPKGSPQAVELDARRNRPSDCNGRGPELGESFTEHLQRCRWHNGTGRHLEPRGDDNADYREPVG